MARLATWTEVRQRYDDWVKRDTFEVIERTVQDYFARGEKVPTRVEIELEVSSEYDDEGGYFTAVFIGAFTVQDASGEALRPFDPDSGAPLEPDAFLDELRDQLSSFESDLREHFADLEERCQIDLLDPPPTPPSLLVPEEGDVTP